MKGGAGIIFSTLYWLTDISAPRFIMGGMGHKYNICYRWEEGSFDMHGFLLPKCPVVNGTTRRIRNDVLIDIEDESR
jgi:hypothetical protein